MALAIQVSAPVTYVSLDSHTKLWVRNGQRDSLLIFDRVQ